MKKDVPEKWNPKTCTREDLNTDAYGEIQFQNKDIRSKYVRVGQNTEMDKMMKLLFQVWKLKPPKLIISVTGGAKDFNLKAKIKNAFKRGLVRAALSTSKKIKNRFFFFNFFITTDAWITSGGNNIGVMKYVGEAIAGASLDPNQKLVVLGISNWGSLANKEQLIRNDKKQLFVEYNVSSSNSNSKTNAFLDKNHSHFVLVDNGQLNVFGGEVEFRAKLEREIVDYNHYDQRLNGKAQIVVIVLGGGEKTIWTVLNSVRYGSPCVFIEVNNFNTKN